jgi:hypothetical protein
MCSRAWSTIRGRCSVCGGERLGSEQLELGEGMIGHLLFYPFTREDGPRGLVFDHTTDADPSGSCGGSIIWRKADGTPGRFTLVSASPLELAEPIICRCGLSGYIRAGQWIPIDRHELGRPHSKGRSRHGAEKRRAPAELHEACS